MLSASAGLDGVRISFAAARVMTGALKMRSASVRVTSAVAARPAFRRAFAASSSARGAPSVTAAPSALR